MPIFCVFVIVSFVHVCVCFVSKLKSCCWLVFALILVQSSPDCLKLFVIQRLHVFVDSLLEPIDFF